MQNPVSLSITNLGGLGDGIAEHEGKRIYVPYTAKGDVITATIGEKMADGFRGTLLSITTQSAERTAAPCPYFTRCGGCQLQHLSPASYSAFKLSRAKQALHDAGYDPALLSQLHTIPTNSRRRAEFKISGNNLGFFRSETNEVITIDACLILTPALAALIAPLKKLIADVPGKLKTIAVTAADNTVDMLINLTAPLDAKEKTTLTNFATSHAVGRLSVKEGESFAVLHQTQTPIIKNGSIEVELPHGVFLQASSASEKILIDWVIKHVGKKKRVLDIFSGIGTFSFPLTEKSTHVAAYEGSAEMTNAITHTAQKNRIRNLHAVTQDLMKHPLDIETLSAAGAVVINPPRAGASAQMRLIAASSLKQVVMVSCNPASFSRDAKMLKKAGFEITHAAALDQFTFSAHLEIMAKFER